MNTENVSSKKESTIGTTLDIAEKYDTSSEQAVTEGTKQEEEEQREKNIFPCVCHSAMFFRSNE